MIDYGHFLLLLLANFWGDFQFHNTTLALAARQQQLRMQFYLLSPFWQLLLTSCCLVCGDVALGCVQMKNSTAYLFTFEGDVQNELSHECHRRVVNWFGQLYSAMQSNVSKKFYTWQFIRAKMFFFLFHSYVWSHRKYWWKIYIPHNRHNQAVPHSMIIRIVASSNCAPVLMANSFWQRHILYVPVTKPLSAVDPNGDNKWTYNKNENYKQSIRT